ncbi:hypothetical protein TSOC111612_11760 [Tsukamurella ocularis]
MYFRVDDAPGALARGIMDDGACDLREVVGSR